MTTPSRPAPVPDRRHNRPLVVKAFLFSEDLIHYAVAALLIALGVYVLAHSVSDGISSHLDYAQRTTALINDILLVIIVAEILATVLAHFDHAGFQLKPFLIIGIISAVRHILTLGAQLSLAGESDTGTKFAHTQIELGVSAGVAIALVVGLLIVRLSDRGGNDTD